QEVPPAPGARPVQPLLPVEVARPAASLRPEPTPEEQQKRAAELWKALVNKRNEEEEAVAPPMAKPVIAPQAPGQDSIHLVPRHAVDLPEPCPVPVESVHTIAAP